MQSISKKVVEVVEPHLARIRNVVENNSKFRIVNCGVIRDGPHLFTVGISCEPTNDPMTDAALSFACVGFTAPGNFVSQFTLSTGWHRSMIAGKHAGFSIYEANAGPFMFTDESDIQKLVSELPRIEAAMLRGLRRGKPPSRFVTVFGKLIGRCNKSQIHSMPQ